MVYTAAVPADHAELVRARELGVPVVPRKEALAQLRDVPGLFDRPAGCLFNPRCTRADERCRTIAPPRQGPDLGEALCHYPVKAEGVAA